MRRRDLIAFLGGAAVASPIISVRGQQPALPVIGFLSSRSPEESTGHVAALLQGLRAFGYVEGRNAVVEYRWATGEYDRLPALAYELVGLRPAVIIAAGGISSARAAKAATSTIPIAYIGGDPVAAGLVTSLNRPDANVTGVSIVSGELGGKRLELLAQLIPGAQAIALLINPLQPIDAAVQTQDAQLTARKLGRQLVIVGASTSTELERSFSTLVENRVAGLVVQNDPFFDSRRDQLITLAAKHRIPAIYHIREFPAGGGLMSYGASLADAYHQVGILAGRILKGARVADLPVAQPTRFEFVINMKAAEALGLLVPTSLLAQADEIIE